MKVWVVIEEDRGCGVSVVGVYYNKDNVILHSHEYLYESEIHDAPGNAQQPLQPDNGYVCNRPGQCAKGQGGKCYSGFDCPDKAIAG